MGLLHPSLGVKIHSPEKATMLIAHQRPGMMIFVETGTFRGDMLERLAGRFTKLYSIELSEEFYTEAQERFRDRGHITLLQGDSGTLMRQVLEDVHEPALFWLDAHAPGAITLFGPYAAPTGRELEAILTHPVRGHVILIDDARQFDRASIARVRELANAYDYRCVIEQGLFILEP